MTELLIFSDAEKRVREFAQEVARKLRPFADICKAHGYTEEEGEELKKLPVFIHYHDASAREWGSATNTSQRGEVKSGITYEEYLPVAYAHACDPDSSDSYKLGFLNAMQKGARVGERAGAGAGTTGGEGVKIVINFNRDQQVAFEKAAPIIELEPASA